jgi:hypothetical protein
MKRPLSCVVSLLSFCALLVLTCFPLAARAQFASGPISVHSVSGQFIIVSGTKFSPLLHSAQFATNANYIRLDPALLAVSAERFKGALLEQLGLKANDPWTGRIFLALNPARSPNDTARLTVGAFLGAWSCRVEMPDLVTLPRYGRALSAALLLELASRHQADPSRVPEIPAWLADGLAQIVFAHDVGQVALSLPAHVVDGLSESRLNKNERGLDPSARARRTLQDSPGLTFDQICWPNDLQINGDDGGVYLASAQMFTTELLALPDGPAKLRRFLAALPGCYNWQTAFYEAFHDDFRTALEVEKWWSLRLVHFTAHDPGPHWTVDISRGRLATLLSVPVEYRSASNSLPQHMQVSLQSAVENFSPEERDAVLTVKLRDLQMAQFRLTQPYAALAGGYAAALAEFLGAGPKKATPVNKHSVAMRHMASISATVKRLDQLDARRRAVESPSTVSQLPTKRRPNVP